MEFVEILPYNFKSYSNEKQNDIIEKLYKTYIVPSKIKNKISEELLIMSIQKFLKVPVIKKAKSKLNSISEESSEN